MSGAKERSFLSDAEQLLLSTNVITTARQGRRDFQVGILKRRRNVLQDTLKAEVTYASTSVIPQFQGLQKTQYVPKHVYSNLARSWIGAFLDEAVSTRARYTSLARKYAKLLLREATEQFGCIRLVVPLMNFDSKRNLSVRGEINGNRYAARIVRNKFLLDPSQHGFWARPYRRVDNSATSFFVEFATDWIMIIDVRYDKAKFSYVQHNGAGEETIRRTIVTALRLFQEGAVHNSVYFSSKDSLYCCGGQLTGWPGHRGILGEPFKIESNRIVAFQRFYRRLKSHLTDLDRLPPRIQISLDYVESSYSKSGFGEFLDLHIALEALFGIQSEQRYRLALRTAISLENKKDELRRTYEFVKNAVNLRNKIAHGDPRLKKPTFSKQVREAIPQLRDLVRRSILMHIDLNRRCHEAESSYDALITEHFEQSWILDRLNTSQAVAIE